MKYLLIGLFLAGLYIFTILTNHDTNVYNGTSLEVGEIPAFSYEDATKVAESLK